MNFIRLLRDGQGPSEFFVNDLQANYLGNIKDLNIIVGANNTRKSRFIRRLINLEHKVILDTDHDINALMDQSEKLFEELDENLLSTNLATFKITDGHNQTLAYTQIKSYFSKKVNTANVLTFFDIRKMVEGIKEQIATVAVKDNINSVKTFVEQAIAIVELIHDIYKNFGKSSNPMHFDTPVPSNMPGVLFTIPNLNYQPQIPDYEKKLATMAKILSWLTALTDIKIVPFHDADMVYIPVLRASRKLLKGDKDLFKETIQSQYELTDNRKLSIETGLDLYEKIERARNGHRDKREAFAAFEKFLSQVFFQSRAIDIIAVKAENGAKEHVMISIEGEMDDIEIHNLGDGIQAIIILLLPIFTAEKGAWIFIDEPENNLHPGYQNILIRAIAENAAIKAKGLRFFINTHSNHILSEAILSASESEILVFTRRDMHSTAISTLDGNAHQTLELLGVLNTSVLISNCSIWVEGPTDRLYLRAFLKAYCQTNKKIIEPIEGFDYSFIEYAGNNLMHYSFDHQSPSEGDKLDAQIYAYFINSNIFLLADSDFNQQDKHHVYQRIASDKPNFTYHHTQVPEIENLLPDSVLQSWLISEINCDPNEVKNLLASLDHAQKLGAFLNDKLSLTKKRKRMFTTTGQGGTLRSDYKNNLAYFLHNGVSEKKITWEQLSESAHLKTLTESLFEFIKAKNTR